MIQKKKYMIHIKHFIEKIEENWRKLLKNQLFLNYSILIYYTFFTNSYAHFSYAKDNTRKIFSDTAMQ